MINSTGLLRKFLSPSEALNLLLGKVKSSAQLSLSHLAQKGATVLRRVNSECSKDKMCRKPKNCSKEAPLPM